MQYATGAKKEAWLPRKDESFPMPRPTQTSDRRATRTLRTFIPWTIKKAQKPIKASWRDIVAATAGVLMVCVLVVLPAQAQTKVFQVDTQGTLTDGLQAYYKFENNFLDFFGSNNLSENPPGFVGFDPGKIGDGVNSIKGGQATGDGFVFVNNNLNISGAAADFTFAGWAKMNQPPDNESTAGTTILTHADAASGNRQVLAIGLNLDLINSPVGTFFVGVSYHGGLFEAVFPFNAIADGNFHFFVLRHAGSIMEVWVDNAMLGSVDGTGNGGSPADQFTVFEVQPSEFRGVVDEVGVWNRALTTTEMSALFNNGNGQTMIDSASPPQTGTVLVTTNNSAATFTISGPTNLQGSGQNAAFTNVPIGPYTIVFGPVAGYFAPTSQTANVTPSDSLTFNGVYTPMPSLMASPSDLLFAYQSGTGAAIPAQVISIASTGPPLPISIEILSNSLPGIWLSASQSSGQTPTNITVTVAPGLPPGTYSGQVVISSAGAINKLNVPVTLDITSGPRAELIFPVREDAVHCLGACSPYTANVSAVFDHEMETPYEEAERKKQDGVCVAKKNIPPTWGIITDFENEEASQSPSAFSGGVCGTLHGYTEATPTPFLTNLNYQGNPSTYLFYDSHPGFDYPFDYKTPARSLSELTAVYPAVSGCISYKLDAAGASADKYHVLAIVPLANQPADGKCPSDVVSDTGYVVFYLHLASYMGKGQKPVACLSPDNGTATCLKEEACPTCVQEDDWVSVDRQMPIAYVGDFSDGKWGGVKPHLHFEVDQVRGAVRTPLDPYGWWSASEDPYTVHAGGINTWLWK